MNSTDARMSLGQVGTMQSASALLLLHHRESCLPGEAVGSLPRAGVKRRVHVDASSHNPSPTQARRQGGGPASVPSLWPTREPNPVALGLLNQ